MTIGDFSEQADAYARSRPGYPDSLVNQLIELASVGPNDTVAEVGAGTGIFTRLLCGRRFHITAIEPNSAMQQKAELPDVTWVTGTFEETHLPDESQHWVVAAQAFHWAKPEFALPEMRRILKPCGMLSVLWNNRICEASEVLMWTENAIRRHVPEFNEAYRDRTWELFLESTGDFEFVAIQTERHEVPMSRQRYLELWRSHNQLNNIAGKTRFERFFDDLSEYLTDRGIERVEVPYRCDAWSARRL